LGLFFAWSGAGILYSWRAWSLSSWGAVAGSLRLARLASWGALWIAWALGLSIWRAGFDRGALGSLGLAWICFFYLRALWAKFGALALCLWIAWAVGLGVAILDRVGIAWGLARWGSSGARAGSGDRTGIELESNWIALALGRAWAWARMRARARMARAQSP
jgi:hypothetical protein